MKRAVTLVAVIGMAGTVMMAAAARKPSAAQYVEARTAEIFTGGCIMGSEAETMGKQAVLAWKVDRGSFNGVSLDGLSVVAALAGDKNLGIARNRRRPRGRPLGGIRRRARQPGAAHRARRLAHDLTKSIVGTIVSVTPGADHLRRRGQTIHVADAEGRARRQQGDDARPDLRRDAVVPPARDDRPRDMGVADAALVQRLAARHQVERPEQALGVLRDLRRLAGRLAYLAGRQDGIKEGLTDRPALFCLCPARPTPTARPCLRAFVIKKALQWN